MSMSIKKAGLLGISPPPPPPPLLKVTKLTLFPPYCFTGDIQRGILPPLFDVLRAM